MEEIWRDVRDYIGLYQVSNWGRVKSLERDTAYFLKSKKVVRREKERILRQTLNRGGYLQVQLSKNGIVETKDIHVLVAEAFLPNQHGYTDVHHKDKNQLNNHVENLEWIDGSKHRGMHAKESKSITVYQYTKDGFLVKVWKSAAEAERVLGFNHQNICNCCNGKRKTHKGYKWSYVPL